MMNWDRGGPYPAGPRRKVRSKTQQACESCYGRIAPGTPHLMQMMFDGHTGLILGAMRLHLEDECRPMPEEDYDV